MWTNHYDGPIKNTEQQSDHIYYILFCTGTALVGWLVGWPFHSHGKLYNYAEPKPFS
jgi:hypothetical protein